MHPQDRQAVTAYDPSAYGDAWAGAYDALHQIPELGATVRTLERLAEGGRVLEFGVGTGRLALPLASRGVAVHGIEASGAMIAQLRRKPGGADLPVTRGDFTQVTVEGTFSLVVCAFHTVLCLPTQELQVRCFERAADHLGPAGRFVVEASVPRPDLFGLPGTAAETGEPPPDPTADDQRSRPPGPTAGNERSPVDPAPMVQRHDPLSQVVEAVHLYLGEGEPVFLPIRFRYAGPSELDLMARLAGLALEVRWGDWSGSAFTPSSHYHVSVYRKSSSGRDVRSPAG